MTTGGTPGGGPSSTASTARLSLRATGNVAAATCGLAARPSRARCWADGASDSRTFERSPAPAAAVERRRRPTTRRYGPRRTLPPRWLVAGQAARHSLMSGGFGCRGVHGGRRHVAAPRGLRPDRGFHWAASMATPALGAARGDHLEGAQPCATATLLGCSASPSQVGILPQFLTAAELHQQDASRTPG